MYGITNGIRDITLNWITGREPVSTGQKNTITLEQAYAVLEEDRTPIPIFSPSWFTEAIAFGLLLEIPREKLNGIDDQDYQTVLEMAFDCEMLTAERLVLAIYGVCGERLITRAGRHLGYEKTPEAYLRDTIGKELNAPITPRNAFLLLQYKPNAISLDNYVQFPPWLKLPAEDRRELIDLIGRPVSRYRYLAELIWRTHEQALLTVGRLLGALKALTNQQALDTICDLLEINEADVLPVNPDFTVYRYAPANALVQELSITDLLYFFKGICINVKQFVQITGAVDLLDEPALKYTLDMNVKFMIILERFLEKKGPLLANDVIEKILYNPGVMQIASAQQMREQLTGQKSDRVFLDRRDLIEVPQEIAKSVKPEVLGNALGIPPWRIFIVLARSQTDDSQLRMRAILFEARRLERSTPENIVYGIENTCINNHQQILNALRRKVPKLATVKGHQQAQDGPLYLMKPEKSEPEVTSVPLTHQILSQIPLSHNIYWIALAMGLDPVEVIPPETSNRPDQHAFQLACKLTNEANQFETAHLLQALEFLQDEEALGFFPPKYRKGNPKGELQLPRNVTLKMKDQRDFIATATNYDSNHWNKLGTLLGLHSSQVEFIKNTYQKKPRAAVIGLYQLAFLSLKEQLQTVHSYRYIFKWIKYFEKPPECHITLDTIKKPAGVYSNERLCLFEQEELLKYFSGRETINHPCTREEIRRNEVLVDNRLLEALIERKISLKE